MNMRSLTIHNNMYVREMYHSLFCMNMRSLISNNLKYVRQGEISESLLYEYVEPYIL